LAVRPLNTLTLETLVSLLSDCFIRMPDHRDSERVDYSMHDTLMSGFALMFFQHPSLLQFQRAMKHRRGRCNLQTTFSVKQPPSDSQMRDVLGRAEIEPLRRLLPELLEASRRAGWAKDFKIRLESGKDQGDYYTMPLDGSEYFHSTKIECPSCLKRADRGGQTQYYHTVVAATLVRSNSHTVLPIDVEEARNSDGAQRQDCELNAAKRLIDRFRQQHPQMKVIVCRKPKTQALALCACSKAGIAQRDVRVGRRGRANGRDKSRALAARPGLQAALFPVSDSQGCAAIKRA
jgi:hypothetical protein